MIAQHPKTPNRNGDLRRRNTAKPGCNSRKQSRNSSFLGCNSAARRCNGVLPAWLPPPPGSASALRWASSMPTGFWPAAERPEHERIKRAQSGFGLVSAGEREGSETGRRPRPAIGREALASGLCPDNPPRALRAGPKRPSRGPACFSVGGARRMPADGEGMASKGEDDQFDACRPLTGSRPQAGRNNPLGPGP